MRFFADDDSFNENLVKENWSEISGRWELKMAALRGRGAKEEVKGDSRGGLDNWKATIRLRFICSRCFCGVR